MRRSTFDASRDQHIAEQSDDRELRCRADGCPNPWSTDITGTRLCGPHSRVEPHQWPAVTQEQREAETERAFRAAHPASSAPVKRWSHADKVALAQRVRALFARADDPSAIRMKGLAQARSLKEREARGEWLSLVQREWWRQQLGERKGRAELPMVERVEEGDPRPEPEAFEEMQ